MHNVSPAAMSLEPPALRAPAPQPPAALDFELPPELQAAEPPEARGLARDEVRLMVSYRANDQVSHARFRDLPCFLQPGDVLLINTSGTLNAALAASRADGTPLELHLSTHLPADLWMWWPARFPSSIREASRSIEKNTQKKILFYTRALLGFPRELLRIGGVSI